MARPRQSCTTAAVRAARENGALVRTVVTWAFVLALVAGCSGGGTEPRIVVKSVDITPSALQLQLVTRLAAQLSATPRNASGAEVTGRAISWSSSDAAIVAVSGTGFVTAIAQGTVTITATVDGVRGSASVAVLSAGVASVGVSLGSAVIGIGETTQATGTVRDSLGGIISGRAVQWSSSNLAVATVSPSGLVAAVAAGTVSLIGTVDGVSGTAELRVVGTLPNLTLDNLYVTQAVQRADGGVPLVANGNPVLVNVFGTLDRPFATGQPPPRVRITLFSGASPLMVDERALTGVIGPVATSAPIHQVVFPATVVQAGLRIVARIDPDSTLREATRSDNSWPRSGQPLDIPMRTVPPLPVRFVPIFLSNGGSTGNVTTATMPEYLYALRQMHPVSTVDWTIGGVFSSDVNFGDGQSAAWLSLLQQLDVLRVSDGATSYYVGALRPPPGVTFVQFGGFSYIPSNPQSTGPTTRTSMVVGVGWFNRARASTELVAHELAHAMGRRHAPCGGAAAPDPGYPYPNASIGVTGHDLYTFSLGSELLPTSHGPQSASDIMSYCTPAWISDYNYEALLQVRTGGVAAAAASDPRGGGGAACECLIVWGSVEGDSVTLRPAFVTRTRTALPALPGPFRLEGETAAGRQVFAYDFAAAEIDHAPNVRHFTFAIPLSTAQRSEVARLRVRYRGRTTELSSRGTLLPAGAAAVQADAAVAGRRIDPATVEVRWDPSRSAAVMVRDPVTGRVLAIGMSGVITVPTTRGELDVVLTDGVRSAVARIAAVRR